MKVNQIKIQDIKPYGNNAKKHSKKQIEQVANSIKRFGFVQPLVVDKNNELIIGHCRLEASKKLGLTEVPVLKVEDLSEEEVKALRLADNKLNESEWDMDIVISELKGLSDDLLDLTGFDKDLVLNENDFGEEFSLADGDKSNFQQITFTLANEQYDDIKNALEEIKQTDQYKYCETFGNENSNGNAIYTIIKQWQQSKI